MIHVVSFENPRMAQAFVDYMASQHIPLKIHTVPEQQQVELWLNDEEHLAKVQHELERFLQDPTNPRYIAASWETGTTEAGFKYRNTLTLANLKAQSGPLTIAVILICIGVYFWLDMTQHLDVLRYFAWPREDQQFELWRWFSPVFVQFSLSQLVFNLVLWWYLASQVERRLGFGKLLTIFLVSALFCNWAQSLYSESNFGGLSGVVYALISYAWLTGERQPEKEVSAPRGLMIFVIVWLFLGNLGVLGNDIANASHISGLIIGLLMGIWDNRHTFKHQSSR
ncbi:rhomboid family intramembrane serine protease GlpG [Providencia vermicola]|uniref:Rhomboid family intramembrane serine protease GlpG n=2 Tax=Providencia TaxID=586 RepID=A0AAI9MUH8_PROST|nr:MULTISPECIES: rhomboid family intramembrane serine protease GlpG [Providencia]ELR5034778.1 rhomboid family intramembrane serine protease GlpG [Providencia stuartii]ELR5122481.1 rhomboid family intramembrane serine protease GlpG [Providencia stuartii]ELX8380479.1 rhomboid family intramembrane serine protease GlpG [Providencia stuartii]ELZ5940265.1 rhomboid family intramembrane serine protease GlpG [Providencia stuartii]EMD5260016.1 rhomboid family intramembrane serine protease GlpG [Providen